MVRTVINRWYSELNKVFLKELNIPGHKLNSLGQPRKFKDNSRICGTTRGFPGCEKTENRKVRSVSSPERGIRQEPGDRVGGKEARCGGRRCVVPVT